MANNLNTITVDGVTYYADAYNATTQKAVKANNALDKDAFLQLLVKQMEYQDPLDPQDNSEYIAQLAQFSSLEQMTNVATQLNSVYTLVDNINTSVLVGQLSNMIGKETQWTDDGSNKYEGTVTGVSISDGAPTIIAQDKAGNIHQVPVSSLTRIGSGVKA